MKFFVPLNFGTLPDNAASNANIILCPEKNLVTGLGDFQAEFPDLIQKHIANEMQAALNEVNVSSYNFKSGVFTSVQFSQNEVDVAQAELESLLARII